VGSMVHGAKERLLHPQAVAKEQAVAVADDAEAPYCTPAFKQVLQRVLNACGLVGSEQRRGCQPADVKTFASITDDDFNALFTPLKDRGAVLMFDDASDTLDDGAKKLLEERWLDRKGARYFFVVARASRDGTTEKNRALSHKRANSVLFHLKEKFQDPDLDSQVGLLWLGSEFAQLSNAYCDWPNSREGGKKCTPEAINRSAFASWVDCRL
jgi:outer membrane protein OmpA-like peptidoglycan-associated protein